MPDNDFGKRIANRCFQMDECDFSGMSRINVAQGKIAKNTTLVIIEV